MPTLHIVLQKKTLHLREGVEYCLPDTSFPMSGEDLCNVFSSLIGLPHPDRVQFFQDFIGFSNSQTILEDPNSEIEPENCFYIHTITTRVQPMVACTELMDLYKRDMSKLCFSPSRLMRLFLHLNCINSSKTSEKTGPLFHYNEKTEGMDPLRVLIQTGLQSFRTIVILPTEKNVVMWIENIFQHNALGDSGMFIIPKEKLPPTHYTGGRKYI